MMLFSKISCLSQHKQFTVNAKCANPESYGIKECSAAMEHRIYSLPTAALALAMLSYCAPLAAETSALYSKDSPEFQADEDATETARYSQPGTMQPARLVRRVNPVYPLKAKIAHIQGPVKLTAIITRTGSIESIQTISGHPLLIAAAKDALKKCIYTPAILNGKPVSMATQIEFPFTLPK